jgi:hypothetical protein
VFIPLLNWELSGGIFVHLLKLVWMGKVFSSESELAKKMMVGDPACKYLIGDRVRKCGTEEGDHHIDNSPCTIKGSLHTLHEE